MIMKMVFPNGSWIVGKRHIKFGIRETEGTHHFLVIDNNVGIPKGAYIAVPVCQVLYFILDYKP